MSIQLLVGLGNPGSEYAQTRHNAGFWLLDRLADSQRLQFRTERAFKGEVCRLTLGGGHALWLLKPATFMNRSGESVQAMTHYYKLALDQVLVVHDELDLAPGVVRLKQGGGHGGHNGLRDLLARLGGGGFWRLRVGIGHPGHKDRVVPYVLDRPGAEDSAAIDGAIDFSLSWLPRICAGEFQRAMNALHRRPASGTGPEAARQGG